MQAVRIANCARKSTFQIATISGVIAYKANIITACERSLPEYITPLNAFGFKIPICRRTPLAFNYQQRLLHQH